MTTGNNVYALSSVSCALLVFLMVGGCERTLSQQKYIQEHNRIFREHEQHALDIATRIIGDAPEDPIELRRFLANRTREDTKGFEKLLAEAVALEPPSEFRQLHRELVNYLNAMVVGFHQFADAIEAGCPEGIEEVDQHRFGAKLKIIQRLQSEKERLREAGIIWPEHEG